MKNNSILYTFSCVFILLISISSCKESYTRVQKSTDANYKLKKALEYYDKKKYYQAIPIFEELMGLLKGDSRAEEVYFKYSNAEYEEKNYIIAAYHFKRFFEVYPESPFAEEALYKYALSFAKQSPTSDLEQVNTEKSIEAYQYFINIYPNSTKVALCNEQIDKMRKKLEIKALSIGDLYYKTENYRAAALSFKQALKDFPEISDYERINFMILKSDYKFARLSITEKKPDRYKDLLKDYKSFAERYPQSKYMEEANKYYEISKYEIVKAYFEYASMSRLDQREKIYNDAIRNYGYYKDNFKDDKIKKKTDILHDKIQFQIVKNAYLQIEDSSEVKKNYKTQHFISVYQNFIDKFAASKFKRQAEKYYLLLSEKKKK